MMRRAKIAQCDVCFIPKSLIKRHRNMRLSDTWLPRKQDRSALLLRGQSPSPDEQIYLLFTPEQRRQLGTMLCFEAALYATRPHHLPDRYWLHPPFQCEGADLAIIKVSPSEPMRARTNQHCPGLRLRLQARGEVRRLTNDSLFRGNFVDQQLAHNDSAGRNANASLQHGADICSDVRYGVNECERGTHCLVGIILLRERVAKVGEHAIAHVSSDLAMVAADDLGDAGMVRRHNPPHVLRVQSCRQCCGADQIAEHNRKVASLGLFRFGHRFEWCGGDLIKFGYSAQHLTAMPEQHPKVL